MAEERLYPAARRWAMRATRAAPRAAHPLLVTLAEPHANALCHTASGLPSGRVRMGIERRPRLFLLGVSDDGPRCSHHWSRAESHLKQPGGDRGEAQRSAPRTRPRMGTVGVVVLRRGALAAPLCSSVDARRERLPMPSRLPSGLEHQRSLSRTRSAVPGTQRPRVGSAALPRVPMECGARLQVCGAPLGRTGRRDASVWSSLALQGLSPRRFRAMLWSRNSGVYAGSGPWCFEPLTGWQSGRKRTFTYRVEARSVK